MSGVFATDHVNQPVVERLSFAPGRLVRLDNRVLAQFECVIQVARDSNIRRDQAGVSKNPLNLQRHVHEHQSSPMAIRRLFDLPEAVRG